MSSPGPFGPGRSSFSALRCCQDTGSLVVRRSGWFDLCRGTICASCRLHPLRRALVDRIPAGRVARLAEQANRRLPTVDLAVLPGGPIGRHRASLDEIREIVPDQATPIVRVLNRPLVPGQPPLIVPAVTARPIGRAVTRLVVPAPAILIAPAVTVRQIVARVVMGRRIVARVVQVTVIGRIGSVEPLDRRVDLTGRLGTPMTAPRLVRRERPLTLAQVSGLIGVPIVVLMMEDPSVGRTRGGPVGPSGHSADREAAMTVVPPDPVIGPVKVRGLPALPTEMSARVHRVATATAHVPGVTALRAAVAQAAPRHRGRVVRSRGANVRCVPDP